MQLIRGLDRWPGKPGCVATIGNFDGVHRGHQAMFAQLREAAQQLELPACVISFEPLPHEYFSQAEAPRRLQGLRDRVTSIAKFDIDQLLLLRFDAEFAAQSAADFIQNTLVETAGVRHVVVGDDFRFGHKRQGDVTLLEHSGEKHKFRVERTATISDSDLRISSTRIRDHLCNGELATAAQLLGRPYRISGRVIHGEKVGRQLGFPTANIALHGHRPPLRGVFAVVVTHVESGTLHPAVVNLGIRPTIGGHKLLLEAHLLDGEIDLYGHHLQVDFIEFLRGEQRFDSLDSLQLAIAHDVQNAARVLSGNPILNQAANPFENRIN